MSERRPAHRAAGAAARSRYRASMQDGRRSAARVTGPRSTAPLCRN
ncbi:hypothetical protein GLA29479_2494 [Lysobacter antibioticus]|nr:hypothetical protein GLA29479_2494 [Lysobacter antibioticus]